MNNTSAAASTSCVESPVRAWLCASACVLLGSCIDSPDLYVAPNGSDFNAGTQAAPLLTIAHADSLAHPGVTIHVAPGTYHVYAPSAMSVGISTTHSGTASARIKFVSIAKGAAKIFVSGTGITWNATGDFVDIDGFDISGSGRHGILASGANLRISNNFVHDLTISGGCSGAGGAAIDTDGPIGNVIIHSNIIRNIGRPMTGACNTVQGIYIANANNTVTNNIVSGVAAVGIQQWHGATASRIVNNTVFRCKIGILIGQGDAGGLPGGSENNYVANNIVYDNMTFGIVEGGRVGDNNFYVNNLIYSSGTALKVAGVANGTIYADPLFVDYQSNGTGNYRIRNTSPALRRGISTNVLRAGAPPTKAGTSVNIGAYED